MLGLDACPEVLPGIAAPARVLQLVPPSPPPLPIASNVRDMMRDFFAYSRESEGPIISAGIAVVYASGRTSITWTRHAVQLLRFAVTSLAYRIDHWTHED